MSKSKGINAPRTVWTGAMLETLRLNYPDKTAKALAAELGVSCCILYAKAHALGLKKSEAFKASGASGRLDGVRGAATRFKPGNQPWTAGQKGLHLSPATQFQKGDAPVNRQEVGALRINSLGDIDIKLAPGPRQWLSLRRYVWQQAHGPIPPGMCVVPDNGDGHDTRIENLKLVTRAENIRINLLRKYPKELRNVMALRGRLANQITRTQESAHV